MSQYPQESKKFDDSAQFLHDCAKVFHDLCEILARGARQVEWYKAELEEQSQLVGIQQKTITKLLGDLEILKSQLEEKEGKVGRALQLLDTTAKRLEQNPGLKIYTNLSQKDGVSTIESISVRLGVKLIVDAFCRLLHITNEDFYTNLNIIWHDRLKKLVAEDGGIVYFNDLEKTAGQLSVEEQRREEGVAKI